MRILRIGDKRAAVEIVQADLNRHGFHCTVDSDFGSATEARVIEFQLSAGLTPDGIVGPRTRAALAGDGIVDMSPSARALAYIEALPDGRVARMLLDAHSWVGERESRANWSPRLSVIVEDYWDRPGYPPWCALFCSHVIRRQSSRWPRLGAVFQIWNIGLKWHACVEPEDMIAGDLFCMGRGGSGSDAGSDSGIGSMSRKWSGVGHVGIVVAVEGDCVLTIEGNIGNACQVRTRKLSDIVGGVRWDSWI